MIVFLTARAYTKTFDHISRAMAGRADLRVMTYAELFESQSLERATYIFTDHDRLAGPDALNAGVIFRNMRSGKLRVLNDPALIRSRAGLLRLLFRRRINSFNAIRLEEERPPRRWPVFLRCIGGHLKETTSDLCADEAELDRTVQKAILRGFPISDLVIVEYAGEEVSPGLFRKLSTFRIGERYFAANNVHDDNWHAKIGKKGIATPDLYRDELRIVRDNPYGDALRDVFELAHIDFGRADYGFHKGRPQIWEINTKPTVTFSTNTHPSADRMESYRVFKTNFLDALEAVDSPAGGKVRIKPQQAPAAAAR